MITSDNVVEDASRTSAADSTVGTQRRDSLQSVEHVGGEAKSSRCAGARVGYAPKCRETLRARLQAGFCAANSTRFVVGAGLD